MIGEFAVTFALIALLPVWLGLFLTAIIAFAGAVAVIMLVMLMCAGRKEPRTK